MGTQETRVLVVDDEPLLRVQLSAVLSELGLDVVGAAENGRIGADLAGLLRPDVVLMDLRMPVMNGVEATRIIRQARPAPAVILLTAYDDPALKDAAEQAGAFDYLVKGCRSEFMLGVVRIAAEQSSRERLAKHVA